jgi:hypothetical protein
MKNILLYLLALIIVSCAKMETIGDDFDKSPITFDIDSSIDKQKIYADGSTVIELVASINPRAIAEYTSITFRNNTINSGEFEGKDKDGNRIVKINNDGTAKVKWKVPNNGGIYYVEASINGKNGKFTKEISIDVKNINKIIALTPDESSLKNIQVDESKTITFTAKIEANLPEIYKTLVFECSDGKFVGVGEDKKREILVNDAGEANVLWRLSNTAGEKFVSVSIKGVANSKIERKIDLVASVPDFKMTISNKNSILADGVSLLNVLIDDARNIPGNKIQIFKSAGDFIDAAGSPIKNGEVNLSNGKASVFLKIGQSVEDYFIKSQTIDGVIFRNETFIPKRAYGETIFADATLQSNNDIQIITYLKRGVGKVSVGTAVNFKAYQTINNVEKTVGVFQNLKNAVTDIDEKTGIIILKFSDDINKSMPIFISVSSQKQDGTPLVIDKPISLNYP